MCGGGGKGAQFSQSLCAGYSSFGLESELLVFEAPCVVARVSAGAGIIVRRLDRRLDIGQ